MADKGMELMQDVHEYGFRTPTGPGTLRKAPLIAFIF